MKSSRAFTLIELMVSVSIIAVLTTLGFATVRTVQDRSRKIKEVAAARTLINAYVSATSDNNNRFPLGYDQTVGELPQPDGSVISGEPAHRYPYRLAPYFSYQIKDTILVNYNTSQIGQQELTYMTSLNPALGINALFVGGNTVSATGDISLPDECLRSPAVGAASLLVFASAAYDNGGRRINGYFKVTPPQLTSPQWSTQPWSNVAPASQYGNVDARYSGQAVCAFTDGSIRSLSIDELRDMRLWNYHAAEQDKPNYTVASPNASGGGRL